MRASPRQSPFFTAIIVLAVGAAVLYAQVREHEGYWMGGLWQMDTHFSHGWPATALSRTVTKTYEWNMQLATIDLAAIETDYNWLPAGVLVNIVALLIVLLGTVLACELWRRRAGRWWQFNLRDLLAGVTIAAILLALDQNKIWLNEQLSAMFRGSTPYLNAGIRYEPWYVQAPLLFGLGCVIYSIGWLATKLLSAGWASVRARSSAAGSPGRPPHWDRR